MDVKGDFYNFSQVQLAQKISDLVIDDDLIRQTQFFLINKQGDLIINGHINLKYKVEIRVSQGSPVSFILFLIYISRVFFDIKSCLLQVTCLSFIDNFGFPIASNSIIKIEKILEKAGKYIID